MGRAEVAAYRKFKTLRDTISVAYIVISTRGVPELPPGNGTEIARDKTLSVISSECEEAIRTDSVGRYSTFAAHAIRPSHSKVGDLAMLYSFCVLVYQARILPFQGTTYVF